MSKSWLLFSFVGLSVMLSGCGGSSSGTPAGTPADGGTVLSQYQATLPDGSPMEIEIFGNDGMGWSGTFAVAAETGPYAFQSGSFEGKITGNSISADCQAADGTEFQLTGASNGDKSFTLTRSDIPGTVLTFTPVEQSGPKHLANVTCTLNTSGTSGQAVLNTTPYSVQGGGTLTEYRGTWKGLNLTFWSYSSGYASLAMQVNDWAIGTINFAKLSVSDVGATTLNSASGNVQIWSPVSKIMYKFGSSGTISPG